MNIMQGNSNEILLVNILQGETLTDVKKGMTENNKGTLNYTLTPPIETTHWFPFQYLPDVCKQKVFSYLSALDRGRASMVCQEWNSFLKSASCWGSVDLSELPVCCLSSVDHVSKEFCYSCYRSRVHKFLKHLIDMKPILKRLDFKFDIGDSGDQYLPRVQQLLRAADCKGLKYAHINWKETPVRKLWLDFDDELTPCEEVVQSYRFRQRTFCEFFEFFTSIAPKITTLILPFDWFPKTVEFMARLHDLHTLVLEKYYVFQHLGQDVIDNLLGNLPKLKRLLMEVWTPSGYGLVPYCLSSPTLEHLDISQSRGFYLGSLSMPLLRRIRVARHPWNGPLVLRTKINLPCLYEILVVGAPNLVKINDHYLLPEWKQNLYGTLQEVLKAVCSCRIHKTGWAM